MRRRTLLQFVCCLLSAPLLAQTAVFHAETHLVTLTFSVHDSSGSLVSNLTKLDQNSFSIEEDGVPQSVRFFSTTSSLPLALGLLIDASPSQDKFVRQHLRDVRYFLDIILQPRDRVFALGFGDHLRVISDFTSDSGAIVRGIQSYGKNDSAFPELDPDPTRDGGTALNDAVVTAVSEKLSAIPAQSSDPLH